MQITEVYYKRTIPTGNYSSATIGLTATVGPGEGVADVVRQLDQHILDIHSGAAYTVHPDVLSPIAPQPEPPYEPLPEDPGYPIEPIPEDPIIEEPLPEEPVVEEPLLEEPILEDSSAEDPVSEDTGSEA